MELPARRGSDIGAGFTIRGSTFGSGRWCTGDVFTIGGGRGGIGGTGRLDTLGDRRRGKCFPRRNWIGEGSGVPGDAHRWHAPRKAVIALSWASYTVMGVSLMANVSVLIMWRMGLAGVTIGAVIY